MKKFKFFKVMLLILILLLTIFLGLVSASEPKYGGTLKIGATAFPVDYDPPMCQSTSSRVVTHQVFEGLVAIDNNSEIVPMLVKSWDESEDGKTYTFFLREGIKFHNGKEMDAEDVIASIIRAKECAYNKMGIDKIENIYSKDKYTVVVELQEPTVSFMIRLSNEIAPVAIMPKEIIEGVPGRQLDTIDELVGTGPFKYDTIVPDQYIKLTRFEEYKSLDVPPSGRAGSKIPYIDEVFIYPVTEVMTRLAGLQTGEYDIVQALSADLYSVIEEDPSLKTELLEPGNTLIMMFNTINGLMTDQKLRRAVQHAIDCDEILMGIKGNEMFYNLEGGLFTKNQKWYSDVGLEHYNLADVEGSRKMVEDLGYKGKEVRIITTKDIMVFYDATIVLNEQLKKIGLEPKMVVVDWATNVEKFTSDHSDWEISFTYYSARTDPTGFTGNFDGSQQPYKTDEMDELLEKVATTIDFETRYELTKDLQNLVMNDIPVYIPGRFYDFDALRSNVHDYKTFDGSPAFWNVWKE